MIGNTFQLLFESSNGTEAILILSDQYSMLFIKRSTNNEVVKSAVKFVSQTGFITVFRSLQNLNQK
jgi:hypothetical protein